MPPGTDTFTPIPTKSFSPDSDSGFFDRTETVTWAPATVLAIAGGMASSPCPPASPMSASGFASRPNSKESDFCSPSRSAALSIF